jgi:hypothetical protein
MVTAFYSSVTYDTVTYAESETDVIGDRGFIEPLSAVNVVALQSGAAVSGSANR